MPEIRRYTVGNNRLQRSALHGFEQTGEGEVRLKGGNLHFMALPCFRQEKEGAPWGRFHLKSQLPREAIMTLRAFALDLEDGSKAQEMNQMFSGEALSWEEKREIFIRLADVVFYNHEDVLLYELKGRFLWVSLEVMGEGAGSIYDMALLQPGDSFMETFPEVYREEGGFFHRYMSVFSSLYMDIQREIDQTWQYLDPKRAPKEMLPELAGWLGIYVEEDFLEEGILRELIENACHLNRRKGTRGALLRLAEIVLGGQIRMVERNLLAPAKGDEEALYRRLYGDSQWDVTLLANREPEEKLQERFLFLAAQFKPARCRLRLIFYQNDNRLDSYCFLDQNARLSRSRHGNMEGRDLLDGSVVLS